MLERIHSSGQVSSNLSLAILSFTRAGRRIHEQQFKGSFCVVPYYPSETPWRARTDTVGPCRLKVSQDRPNVVDNIIATLSPVSFPLLLRRSEIGCECVGIVVVYTFCKYGYLV